jgi:glutathione S-transferase
VARGEASAGHGLPAMRALMDDRRQPHPPLAPPFLQDGPLLIGQVGAILQHLGPALKLVPRNAALQVWTQQIQLTIGDLVAEVHALHAAADGDPGGGDQRPGAHRRAAAFCGERLPAFLQWCETILRRNPAGSRHLVGGKLSYADLSLFQLVQGLRHACPRAAGRALSAAPGVVALHDRVADQPRVAAYLRSPRRLPFNEQGLFRHDPDLDAATP